MATEYFMNETIDQWSHRRKKRTKGIAQEEKRGKQFSHAVLPQNRLSPKTYIKIFVDIKRKLFCIA